MERRLAAPRRRGGQGGRRSGPCRGRGEGGGQAAAASAGPETPSPAAAAKAAASRVAASGPADNAAPPRPGAASHPAGTTGGGRGSRGDCAEQPAVPDRGGSPAGHPGAGGQVDAACCRAGGPTCSKPSRPSARWPGPAEKATVAGLDSGSATLSFANEGYARGFASSGYDADLSRVLKAMFGISRRSARSAAGPPAPAGAAATRPGGAPPPAPRCRTRIPGWARPGAVRRPGRRQLLRLRPAGRPGRRRSTQGLQRPPRGEGPPAQGAGACASAPKAARRGATGESGGSGAPGPSRAGHRGPSPDLATSPARRRPGTPTTWPPRRAPPGRTPGRPPAPPAPSRSAASTSSSASSAERSSKSSAATRPGPARASPSSPGCTAGLAGLMREVR